MALVHSYLNDREGKDRPDRLTRLGILAAAELYRHNEIGKIVFTAKEELSDSQASRIKYLLTKSLPENNVVVDPKAVYTRQEIETFYNLSVRNNWDDLIVIGNIAHLPRIRKELKNIFKDQPVKSTDPEEVLSEYPRYSQILADAKNWPEQFSLSLQEKLLKTPFFGNLILKTVPLFSKYKLNLHKQIFSQIERIGLKYNR